MTLPEIFIGLLLVVTSVAVLAQYLKIPYPIALVVSGICLAFIPSLPHIPLNPDLIFFVFLPPLLTEAAYFTSIRELQNNIRNISFLAVGLVFVTSAAVAFIFVKLIPGMSWATGFLLGAVVSPPDAVAISAIAKRLHLPRKTIAILEGESLVNDATALVIYKFAIMTIITGYFSVALAGLHFLWVSLVGVGVGILFGTGFMRFFYLIKENSIAITTTFIIPFAAYLVAEFINGSGVLAVVTAGLITAWYAPEKFSPGFRLRSISVWQTVTFLLNGFVFVLIGLQFPVLFTTLDEYSIPKLMSYGLYISLTVIIVRFLWVFGVAYGLRFLFPKLRQREPYPPWQSVFVIAWSGMRGVISLAAALALPIATTSGDLFPFRDLIIFLAFVVIFVTLVIQGLLLPFIIKRMNFEIDPIEERERWHAKVAATKAALAEIDALYDAFPDSPSLEKIRTTYENKLENLGNGPTTPLKSLKMTPSFRAHEQRLWFAIINAERKKILEMRKQKEISDTVLHELQAELDIAHEQNQRS